MPNPEQTFEASPPKCLVQRVVEMLSIRTNAPSEGGFGGRPELETNEVAIIAAMVRDPVAKEIIGALQADERAIRNITQELDGFGWHLWRSEKRQGWIDLRTHYRLCEAVVTEFRLNRSVADKDVLHYLQVGKNKKVAHLLEHRKSLNARLAQAYQSLTDTLRREMKNDAA